MTESSQPPGTLSLPERLALVYERLADLSAPRTADEALEQLSTTLDQVEDEYSGVPRNPNPGLKFDGRMYPPRSDFIERTPDGGLVATTKGNMIHASPDGALRITSRRTGEEVYSRAGGEAAPPQVSRTAARSRSTTTKRGPGQSSRTPSPQSVSPAHRQQPEQQRGRGKGM